MKKQFFYTLVILAMFGILLSPTTAFLKNGAAPAIPATPAQPQKGGPAIPATPAKSAVPAHKQDSSGIIILEDQDLSGGIIGDNDINGTFSYYVEENILYFSFTGKAPTANNWYALVMGVDPINSPETSVILSYPRSHGDTGEIIINDGIFELPYDLNNAKVWLVLGSDIITSPRYDRLLEWTNYRPEYYLFGTSLIHY